MKKEFFKIKVAIFFGYNGKGFQGSQKLPLKDAITVEGELEKALYNCKMISESNFDSLQNIGWGRGSRTDKGVHAVANVVNCKISLDSKFLKTENEVTEIKKEFKQKVDWKKVIAEINSNLPASINTFAIKLVTKGFDARRAATSRRYEYVCPISLFRTEKNKDASNEEILENIGKLTQRFLGAHNFHNFTRRLKPTDKQSYRVIHEVKVEIFKPEHVKLPENQTLIVFYFHGQSFLYHQIRKMVGILPQSFHRAEGDELITRAFEKEKLDIWIAPSEGLLLDRVR